MTIFSLVGWIGFVAVMVTLVMQFVVKNVKTFWVSLLQNFCGILFIFSGWVKAIDPLGTAFKMEQYFDQFEVMFSGSIFSFLAPLFPAMNQYSTAFSVFMIIFEIVLGIMLVIGAKPKFTAWSFFLLVLFFTKLTGFTFLTGYVPEGVNFFSFGDWGPYQAKNMKVTDCGCFGDFIKLEPKVSFIKDLFLLIPALLFLWHSKKFHQLFSFRTHNISLIVSTIVLLLYSFNNFYWNEPHIDFRPFKIGTHVRDIKAMESDAQSKVQVTGFMLKNKETGEVKELETAEYMKNFAQYPKEKWETLDQIKSAPTIKPTKISEFFLKNINNEEAENVLLDDTTNSVVLVSYKSYFSTRPAKKMVKDSLFTVDTLAQPDGSTKIVKVFSGFDEKEVEYNEVVWDADYLHNFKNVAKPFVDKASAKKWNIYVITAGLNKEQMMALEQATGITGIYMSGDDILLKTIMRSNPGIMHWKDGKIINKWHYKKLPDFDTIVQ
ncbi:MAG: DoxX family protein [Saprospiraceae bacterium]|nr:DoxX family protein [Saprospiraceae bacterium]